MRQAVSLFFNRLIDLSGPLVLSARQGRVMASRAVRAAPHDIELASAPGRAIKRTSSQWCTAQQTNGVRRCTTMPMRRIAGSLLLAASANGEDGRLGASDQQRPERRVGSSRVAPNLEEIAG